MIKCTYTTKSDGLILSLSTHYTIVKCMVFDCGFFFRSFVRLSFGRERAIVRANHSDFFLSAWLSSRYLHLFFASSVICCKCKCALRVTQTMNHMNTTIQVNGVLLLIYTIYSKRSISLLIF